MSLHFTSASFSTVKHISFLFTNFFLSSLSIFTLLRYLFLSPSISLFGSLHFFLSFPNRLFSYCEVRHKDIQCVIISLTQVVSEMIFDKLGLTRCIFQSKKCLIKISDLFIKLFHLIDK